VGRQEVQVGRQELRAGRSCMQAGAAGRQAAYKAAYKAGPCGRMRTLWTTKP
jgi:hypothetical protein